MESANVAYYAGQNYEAPRSIHINVYRVILETRTDYTPIACKDKKIMEDNFVLFNIRIANG